MVQTDLLLDPFGTRFAHVLTAARVAEEAGFDGIWTWDHLAGSVHRATGVLECWTVLSALAVATSRVALGPLVLNVANRHPGVVAVMAATLQEVSGGRLLLGLGAGGGAETPYAAEQEALGRPVPADPARRRQVEEMAACLRRIWTGRTGAAAPTGDALRAASGFARPEPLPPIVIGGFGPKMAELAGRVGDGINAPAGPDLAGLLDVARRARGEAGGDPDRFLVTATAGLEARWLDPGSRDRARMATMGVQRMILFARPDNPTAIERAGRLLSRHR